MRNNHWILKTLKCETITDYSITYATNTWNAQSLKYLNIKLKDKKKQYRLKTEDHSDKKLQIRTEITETKAEDRKKNEGKIY